MTSLSRLPFGVRMALLLMPLLLVVAGLGAVLVGQVTSATPEASDRPPPGEGYFSTRPPGSWHKLPSDSTCAGRVHRSLWEPRPDNDQPNHRRPNVAAVHAAFKARPRAVHKAYVERWDHWLLQRVTGHFAGTTDEIFQWAACKWGLSDNLLRAMAERESGWYQYEIYPDGSCVPRSGCGDEFPEATRASRTFCRMTATTDPRYLRDYAPGRCPKTFSIVGVMSWQDPRWGRMPDNQNGTFPFNRDSTAFAVDYVGSFLRGCYEGWVTWLGNTGRYHPGNLRGCVGAWYDGSWFGPDARTYIHRVWSVQEKHPWLDPRWARRELPCSPTDGCPRAPS
jgi:hypothetical protein